MNNSFVIDACDRESEDPAPQRWKNDKIGQIMAVSLNVHNKKDLFPVMSIHFKKNDQSAQVSFE